MYYRDMVWRVIRQTHLKKDGCLPLARRLGGEPAEKIAKACLELGAELEENADVCARFFFLPKFPVTVKIWLQDDEMEGSANILFDASANSFLHSEDIVAVGDMVSHFLIKQYKLMYGAGV